MENEKNKRRRLPHRCSHWCAMTVVILFLLSCSLPAYAADGKVTYSGNAGKFVFAPGSDHSLTDLFPNFKGVMPGDTLTQKITVKNDADNKVKVKIYIRSLGAQEDSKEFLSQLDLKVQKSGDNQMAYMFDAAASEKGQLYEWVCLGTLYSGGEVNLDVSLTVPTELSNAFQNQVGKLDWEFMIEEFPVAPDDPVPPLTGDDFNKTLVIGIMAGSLAVLIFLFILLEKKKKGESK